MWKLDSLLLLDIAGCHPEDLKIVILPANTTPRLQSPDLGTIKAYVWLKLILVIQYLR